ncbi:TonB-dependent receptor [Paraglaciecola aquimarina]|uniref:TonB-dependent receptor n=1 Tax=Paraglaciecola aquimarina TaxID=1235557 RepID=A0ABU3SW30_9ALTE|nr:TonB-dependent receptor [Paraglaciecola aquimarina]MDU0354198.1 TonB-dependent receptor [Paraglaciecola aquimarina]
MRPNTTINEAIWSNQGWGGVGNSKLRPLISTNLDLSFEWYFDESSIFSVGLFNKDMTDRLESLKETYYWRDLRTDYRREDISIDELLMIPNGQTPADGCMPVRNTQWENRDEAWDLGCHEVSVSVLKNGEKAHNRGVELNFTDNFDSLPGVLSGLGVSMNYTFSDAGSKPERSEVSGLIQPSVPSAWTPRHSSNSTLFWKYKDVEMRLAHRYNGVRFQGRVGDHGMVWADQTHNVDFSVNYRVNSDISVSLHALNLTDQVTRSFYTASNMPVPGRLSMNDDGHYLNEHGQVISVVYGDGFIPATEEQIMSTPELQSQLTTHLIQEGNPMKDNGVDRSRTIGVNKTGRQYRLSVRVNF